MRKTHRKKNKMKKVSVEKKLACFSIVLFVLSITPILYLAGYVHATGDDYGSFHRIPIG